MGIIISYYESCIEYAVKAQFQKVIADNTELLSRAFILKYGRNAVFLMSLLSCLPDAVSTRVGAVLRFPVYGREERTKLTVEAAVFKSPAHLF